MKTGFSLCENTTQGKPCSGPVRDCSEVEGKGTTIILCTTNVLHDVTVAVGVFLQLAAEKKKPKKVQL